MKKQQGFTLIELMIVVAIIGILAAIAIPAYQDYIARSQVAEASTLIGGARTAIEEDVAQNGAFPDAETYLTNTLGVRTSGQYVLSIVPADSGNGTGTLTATFRATGVSQGIVSDTLIFNRDANGAWTCDGATSSLGAKYAPKPCGG